MKNIIINFFIISISLCLSYLLFKYLFLNIDITSYIHIIIEPQKTVYFGLNYLGYLYFIYGVLVLLLMLGLIFLMKKKKYYLSIYILIAIHLLIAIYGLYIQLR